MEGSAEDERILRAKYLDWCSARLADRFLALSPDEIYELAQSKSHGRDPLPDPALVAFGVTDDNVISFLRGFDAPGEWPADDSFRSLVTRAAEALADQLHLPPFEEWSVAYQEDPSKFDDELIGFWKEEV